MLKACSKASCHKQVYGGLWQDLLKASIVFQQLQDYVKWQWDLTQKYKVPNFKT